MSGVLIVGAGFAGAVYARTLAGCGIDVHVVDRPCMSAATPMMKHDQELIPAQLHQNKGTESGRKTALFDPLSKTHSFYAPKEAIRNRKMTNPKMQNCVGLGWGSTLYLVRVVSKSLQLLQERLRPY